MADAHVAGRVPDAADVALGDLPGFSGLDVSFLLGGVERGQGLRPADGGQEQVLDALFGGTAQRSAAERAISTSSGNAEMGIRSSVGDPQTNTVNKGSITRDILAAPEGDGQTAQAVIPG